MIANVENMRENFKIYNKMYFEGKLPLPKFEVMHTYRKSVVLYSTRSKRLG